ncbi:hypothetical protein ACFCV9_03980 [Streptomyces sp. NPDC056367]|uniref:hypothetical protein n=1 Tax=Streptomyces sp. NPDC056367 TaxID=3345797 RepID=UPI0035D7C923
MRRIATIGVYGFTADAFLGKLTRANVGLLLDLGQRRGVRGADYSWANSVRLQRALGAVGTGYRHMRGLAPTTELRHLQYREDDRQCVGKRSRIVLAREYAERYTREILDRFDLDAVVPELPRNSVTALFIATAFVHSSHVRPRRGSVGAGAGVGAVKLAAVVVGDAVADSSGRPARRLRGTPQVTAGARPARRRCCCGPSVRPCRSASGAGGRSLRHHRAPAGVGAAR